MNKDVHFWSPATAMLAQITHKYGLSETDLYARRSTEGLTLAIATEKAISFYALDGMYQTQFVGQVSEFADGETIGGVTVVRTPASTDLVCTTSEGSLYFIERNGRVRQRATIPPQSSGKVTTGQVNERLFLFICGLDNSIRVMNTLGELLATIETPGLPLSLTVQVIGCRTMMMGGEQGRPHVYLWDLASMVLGKRANPLQTLTGGSKPAFATQFLQLVDQTWLAHGSWDGYIYLYAWPGQNGRRPLSPAVILSATGPVYPIRAASVGHTPYLFAGTENGDVISWQLNSLATGRLERKVLGNFGTRVKCLSVACLRDEIVLLAGCKDGCVHLFRIEENAPAYHLGTLFTGGEDVKHIDCFE